MNYTWIEITPSGLVWCGREGLAAIYNGEEFPYRGFFYGNFLLPCKNVEDGLYVVSSGIGLQLVVKDEKIPEGNYTVVWKDEE